MWHLQMRQLQKKLQQVEMLEARQIGGETLDMQQMIKIQQRPALQAAAAMLASGRSPQEVSAMLDAKRCDSPGQHPYLLAICYRTIPKPAA
jgi:hypothetical protein